MGFQAEELETNKYDTLASRISVIVDDLQVMLLVGV